MTRIGTVRVCWAYNPDTPCFRMVTENGYVQLGCWRAVGVDGDRTIFERVS